MKKILFLFSYVLHPIVIPLLGTIVYLFFVDNYLDNFAKYLLLVQVVLITIFIPGTMLFFLKAMGKVDSVMVSKTTERKIPLLIQLLLMALLLFKSISKEIMPELFFFYLGGIMSTALAFLLLFAKLKVSIHTLAMSSLTIFIIALSIHENTNWIYGIALLIFLNGLVMSSRLVMKAHNFNELFLGIVIGVSPALALLRFWL